MPLSDDEYDLLARLNALKPSSVQLDGRVSMESPKDDLATRFLRFKTTGGSDSSKSRRLNPETEHNVAENYEDDRTIEELLADIGPQDQWMLDPEEPQHIAKLMAEAKASLKEEPPEVGNTSAEEDARNMDASLNASIALVTETEAEAGTSRRDAHDLRTSASDLEDIKSNEGETCAQDQEADVALQRILDELSLDRALIDQNIGSKQTPTKARSDPANETDAVSEDLDSTLDLPSTPDQHPFTRGAKDEIKGTALDLPSAPASKPSKKTGKSNLPTYTSEEIDSWCIICNDDATIRCNGCDGDLYCAKCWKEGHTGPEVGYEERTHRWAKYLRPK